MLNAKSSRQVERTQQEYKEKKRKKWNRVSEGIRGTLSSPWLVKQKKQQKKGEFSTVYKITKQLFCNNTNHTMPVKDKQGKVITTEKEQAARWKQHF